MEEKPHIFEFLRNSIKCIGEDPTAMSNVEKGLCQLETKFSKYAKSMTEVLRVHNQMETEIERLKKSAASQELEIVLAKDEANKSKELITKLKRKNQRLKRQNKKYKLAHNLGPILTKKESTDNYGCGEVINESAEIQGTIENMKK